MKTTKKEIEKEFNLSEKINKVCKDYHPEETIAVPNIKEFIKRLKDKLCRENEPAPKNCSCWACNNINKLAGDKLI